MNKAIHRTFWGTHIDLDKIVAITNAYDIGATAVGFSIYFQLCDKPLDYKDHVLDQLCNDWFNDVLKPAVAKLQKEVDALIAVWSAYKDSQT